MSCRLPLPIWGLGLVSVSEQSQTSGSFMRLVSQLLSVIELLVNCFFFKLLLLCITFIHLNSGCYQ